MYKLSFLSKLRQKRQKIKFRETTHPSFLNETQSYQKTYSATVQGYQGDYSVTRVCLPGRWDAPAVF